MIENHVPEIDYQFVPDDLRGAVHSVVYQIRTFLEEQPPSIDAAKIVLDKLRSYLKEQEEVESVYQLAFDQLLVTLEGWIQKFVDGQKHEELEKQREDKLKEVNGFWSRIDYNDAFSILGITYNQTEDNEKLKQSVKKAYRQLSLQFHSDTNQPLFNGDADELRIELDQIFKLLVKAYDWLNAWIKDGKPTWRQFAGFDRYQGRKKPEVNPGGFERVDQQQSARVEYDKALPSVRFVDLSIGDFLHIRTQNSYYVFKVENIKNNQAFLRCSFGTNHEMVGTVGWTLETKLSTNNMLFFGNSHTSDIHKIVVSKNADSRVDFQNIGRESEGDPLSRMEYNRELSNIKFVDLSIGDFLHIRTQNSYYVFKVENIKNNQAYLRFVSGTNQVMAGTRGWTSTSEISIQQGLYMDNGRTSPIQRMVASKTASPRSDFYTGDKERKKYRRNYEQIRTNQLVVGDRLILSDDENNYTCTVIDRIPGVVRVRCESTNKQLGGVEGTVNIDMIRLGSKFEVMGKGNSGQEYLYVTQYLTSIEVEFSR